MTPKLILQIKKTVKTDPHIRMTSLDLGLFGLDCFVADKTSSLEQDLDIYSATEFENLLNDTSGQNILDLSLQQSGITQDTQPLQDNITVRAQTGQE